MHPIPLDSYTPQKEYGGTILPANTHTTSDAIAAEEQVPNEAAPE